MTKFTNEVFNKLGVSTDNLIFSTMNKNVIRLQFCKEDGSIYEEEMVLSGDCIVRYNDENVIMKAIYINSSKTRFYNDIKEKSYSNFEKMMNRKYDIDNYEVNDRDVRLIGSSTKFNTINERLAYVAEFSDHVQKALSIEKIVDNHIGNKAIEVRNLSDDKNDIDLAVVVSVPIIVPIYEKEHYTRKDIVMKYKKEIDKIVVDYISNNRSFKKYDIPVNFLKLDKLVLCSNGDLVYTFGLKEA